ncbi:MAG: hypothetical protein ACR2IH_00315 [Pyrinomonadaceae bacterium]
MIDATWRSLCPGFLLFLMMSLNSYGQSIGPIDYFEYLRSRSRVIECAIESDVLARRVLQEYGSMFSAADDVILPSKCFYKNSDEVKSLQKKLRQTTINVGGVDITLQEAAAKTLAAAVEDAASRDLKITPFDGEIAGKRIYTDSVRVWNKRFFPALEFWVSAGNITEEESVSARNLPLIDQARKVLQWESQGYLFGTGRRRSIFSSTAPPGASQHLALIAFDVVEYQDPAVREILNAHGWFQTVANDPPHFTYLGSPESSLPSHGLRKIESYDGNVWVPNITRP